MSLAAWRDISDATTRNIAIVGDSTSERGWGRILRDLMKPRWGYGGLGFRHMGKYDTTAYGSTDLGPSVSEWAATGSWTKGSSTDAWNISPITGGVNTNCGTWHASGSSLIQTWTKPNNCPPITSFDIHVADGASAADFSYSIDGGTYTNVPTQTWSHGNALKVITISSSVNSTVAVRAANAAGTAVDLYMVGIEPHCATTGVRVHEICAGGAFSSQSIRTSDTGNWHAWFDSVQPQLCFVLFINDSAFWSGSNPANFQQRLDDFGAMVTGYGGTVIYFSYFMWGVGTNPIQATQDDKRARELAVAKKYGGNYFDLNALTGGDHATELASGYFNSADEIHPSAKGMRIMANHAWNQIGTKLYSDKLVRI